MKEQSPFDIIPAASSSKHLLVPQGLKRAQAEFEARLPGAARSDVLAVLGDAPVSYRDGLLIQLAYGLGSGAPLDLTKRHAGARSVAGRLGPSWHRSTSMRLPMTPVRLGSV